MKKEIFKVTSEQVIKMVENVDYIECKNYILCLSNKFILPIWKMNSIVDTPDGTCIFTYDDRIAELYKAGLKLIEEKKGV